MAREGHYARLIGLRVYDQDARYIGTVRDIWIENSGDTVKVYLLVSTSEGTEIGVETSSIAAAADIVLLRNGFETVEAPRGAGSRLGQAPAGGHPEAAAGGLSAAWHGEPRPAGRVRGLLRGLRRRQGGATSPVHDGYVIPRCPACGSALVFEPRSRRWYCYHCREYVSLPADVEARVPRCPECGLPLSYIERYGRWYCYNCRRYVKL